MLTTITVLPAAGLGSFTPVLAATVVIILKSEVNAVAVPCVEPAAETVALTVFKVAFNVTPAGNVVLILGTPEASVTRTPLAVVAKLANVVVPDAYTKLFIVYEDKPVPPLATARVPDDILPAFNDVIAEPSPVNVEFTDDGVIAPKVNVIAGVVVAVATEPETPLAVTTETDVTVPLVVPPITDVRSTSAIVLFTQKKEKNDPVFVAAASLNEARIVPHALEADNVAP